MTLVEFAIVLPIFITTFFAMIEFGYGFNALLSINRASQNGALIAGQAGSDADADCLILRRVEEQLQAPLNKSNIVDVRIIRTNTTGSSVLAANEYTRSGAKDCVDYTVPYSAVSIGYPENERCDVLNGCPLLTPTRSTVDKIGVEITYRHRAATPMGDLLQFLGGEPNSPSWTFTQRNLSRMEPVQ